MEVFKEEGGVAVEVEEAQGAQGTVTFHDEIHRLSRLWYEAVNLSHYKDRDCHWYITTDYAYGSRPTFTADHPGYIGSRWTGPERLTYEEAALDLLNQLHHEIDSLRSWAENHINNPLDTLDLRHAVDTLRVLNEEP